MRGGIQEAEAIVPVPKSLWPHERNQTPPFMMLMWPLPDALEWSERLQGRNVPEQALHAEQGPGKATACSRAPGAQRHSDQLVGETLLSVVCKVWQGLG